MNKNTKILIKIILVTFNIFWIYLGTILVVTKDISLIIFLICAGIILYVTYILIFIENIKSLNGVQK